MRPSTHRNSQRVRTEEPDFLNFIYHIESNAVSGSPTPIKVHITGWYFTPVSYHAIYKKILCHAYDGFRFNHVFAIETRIRMCNVN
ncbi:hypothetical protein ES332_A05G221900v1 [Gossypium tomentosum]|uniref:Uncharacterized protein n=1 Tax=Gossypium tomentosum TaxID=34277 RepID=A0A5D2QJ66_GOSTO|nr:hypothetical protein ES332_A05G221900v1 [Gossypium tomentosum]